MQTVELIKKMQSLSSELRCQGKQIALVPTMGYLHEGHLSLINLARSKADVVIVSIFVNPKQFGPNEDFVRYPRDLKRDQKLCIKHGVDILFAPEDKAFYPDGFSTYVEEEEISTGLCGISRPGHFRGVCTVVSKLFNIIQPDSAVFGQKDAQQVAIIKKLVKDLNFSVNILVGPTVRDSDGLAMSSRNAFFSKGQRREALKIYESLQFAKELVEKEGVTDASRVTGEVSNALSRSLLKIRVIYVMLVDRDTMKPLSAVVPGRTLLAVAVWLDQVRLIDNIEL